MNPQEHHPRYLSTTGHDLRPLTRSERNQLVSRLTEEERRILLERKTEQTFRRAFLNNRQLGIYTCRLCELPLFRSAAKYDSRTGWPSFVEPFDPDHLRSLPVRDRKPTRAEIRCARCDGHIGHIYRDGQPSGGPQYRVNSVALKFFGGARALKGNTKRRQFEKEALVHLDMLYSVALRFTGNRADAEDLVQDTMTQSYRVWDRYEPGTNCGAWLVTIMRNMFISQYRRRSKRTVPIHFDAVENLDVFEQVRDRDPEASFFHQIVDREVKRAIRELPGAFRAPLVLRDVEGLNYAEIAELLELPVGTVKSRLFRGRRRLQKRLFQYNVNRNESFRKRG